MNTATAKARMAGIVLAGLTTLAALAIPTGQASAAILYSPEGGYANPAAHCDAENHTMQLRMSLVKDAGYDWQKIQFQYRLTNLATGSKSYTALYESTIYSYEVVKFANTPLWSMPSTTWRIDYVVRFGRVGGWNNWSAWTPVEYRQTWRARGWLSDSTTACTT